jgi:hypothetical protein
MYRSHLWAPAVLSRLGAVPADHPAHGSGPNPEASPTIKLVVLGSNGRVVQLKDSPICRSHRRCWGRWQRMRSAPIGTSPAPGRPPQPSGD